MATSAAVRVDRILVCTDTSAARRSWEIIHPFYLAFFRPNLE